MVEQTTFRELKNALIELLRGYPEYGYYGKVEFYLPKTKEKAVDLLIRHKIIEKLPIKEVKNSISNLPKEEVDKLPKGKNRFLWYRLAPRGVDLAISMINLEHGEKMSKYAKETNNLTKTLTWLTKTLLVATIGMIIFAFIQSLIVLWT